MKIVLFYNPSPGTVGEYFHRALLAEGHTVHHLPTSEAAACRERGELYLRIDHGDYSVDLPTRLRPQAFYVVDAHLAKSWNRIAEQARHYDLVYCAQRRAAQRLRRAFWVPLGCDAEIHGRSHLQPTPRCDLAFVGNDGGVPRKFYLQELRERYPHSVIGRAPYRQMADIYHHARIGFHYIECTSPLKDHVSMRVYEILASGTLLLANALEPGAFEGIELRDREHLVVYHDPQELFELIDYYLEHDEERRLIAERGHQCVMQRHTYRHRVKQMVDIFRERL